MNKDTAVVRGIRTCVQVIIAVIIAVWQVPGVPDSIYRTVQDHAQVSVPALAGVIAFIWNYFRKDVKNI